MEKATLSSAQKSKLRREISKQTLDASVSMLKEFGKCMVIRPTGFGKSYMLASLSNKYESSLYVYPLNVIKENVLEQYSGEGESKVKLKNVEFISYSALNNKYKDGTVTEYLSKFSIVMLDECHMAGAAGFVTIYEECRDIFRNDGIHIIGVTATPRRCSKTRLNDGSEDMVSVLSSIFEGHKIFPFTLKDCFNKQLMRRPRYAEIIYDRDSFKSSIGKRLDKIMKSKKITEDNKVVYADTNRLISALARRIDNIENAPVQIRRVIQDERGRHPNYLRFITFCANKKDIEERRDRVTSWFTEAFPSYNIQTHIIVSKGQADSEVSYEDEIKSVECLKELDVTDETIDLIYCVDMLNMGYHVPDIDGVILLRSTQSQIVYMQQIGRCMSVMSSSRPIIFDFVNNIGMSFFKEDKKEGVLLLDESGQPIELEESEDMIFEKEDLFIDSMEDGTGELLSKIEEAMREIEDPKVRETNKMVWWYTEMSAPIAVILYILGKKATKGNVEDIVKRLHQSGLKVESERSSQLGMSNWDLSSNYWDLVKSLED